MEDISRRSFLTGAVAVAGIAATASSSAVTVTVGVCLGSSATLQFGYPSFSPMT